MKLLRNFDKKLLVLLLLFFTSSFLKTTYAESNSSVCGSTPDGGVWICDTSYSQLSWKGTNECEITLIMNENGVYSCEKVTQQCTTGNFPNIMNSINEILSGRTNVNIGDICNEIKSGQGKIDPKIISENVSFEDGLTSTLLDGAGFMYQTPPVEPFRIYAKRTVNDAMAKLDLLDTANAQDAETFYFPGPGYNLLSPISSIWSVMRNVSYGFMIIIVFFISLMILFRRQLNGQQTVNLLNSLPSLFLSAILVTFSYGISGVFLDLIPIGSNFVQYVLVGNPASPGYKSIWNSNLVRTNSNLVFYTGGLESDGSVKKDDFLNQFGITDNETFDTLTPDLVGPGKHAIQIDDEYMSIWQIWGTANPSIFNSLRSQTNNFNVIPDEGVLRNSGVIQQVASSFGNLLGKNSEGNDGLTGDTANVVQSAAGILIDLVFSFAALVATFKLFMSLLKAYLMLILLPAVSPIIFLLAGIPSLTSNMIGFFVKSMLGSALSFIAVYAVFLIVVILAYDQFIQNSTFIPPLLGYSEQANINANGTIIKSLAAYGIFLMTPIIPQKIQEALQSGGENAFGQAVTQGTQQGIATTMMLGNAISQQVKKMVSPKDVK